MIKRPVLTFLAFSWLICPSLATDQSGAEVARELQPLPDQSWDYAKARHLLFRAGFGGAPEEVAKLHALGLRQAVAYLVDVQAQPPADFPLAVKWSEPPNFQEMAKLTPQEREKRIMEVVRSDFQALSQVRDWWLKRMVSSPRQLEEKLTLFWHGHFATEHRTVRSAQAMYSQNQLFRAQAVGNFGKLLLGLIRDPAMLRYLDNNTNVKGQPNENLARELLELFTMGEGQGYTEKDIKEAARALTGYSFTREPLKFHFRFFMHDNEPKTIFGQTGKWNGEDLIKLILQQPATSRFLARKLFVNFVHEEPSEQTVASLAQILKEHNYELAPLLKTMFMSNEFYGSKAMGTQIKSPVQLVVGTFRTLKISPPTPGKFGPPVGGPLAMALRSMGQELFNPPNVKGWDGGRSWINTSTLFLRENFAAGVVTGRGNIPPPPKEGFKQFFRPAAPTVDLVARMRDQKLQTAEEAVDYWAKALLAVPLTAERRQELVAFLGPLPPADQWTDRRSELNGRLGGLLVLLMSMTEYQLT